MKKEMIYIVVALTKETPKILDVFRNKKDAEECAYNPDNGCWCNIIEKELK